MRSVVQRYKHHPWAHNSPLVLESLKPIVAGAGDDVTKDRRSPNSTLRPRLYDMSGSTPAPGVTVCVHNGGKCISFPYNALKIDIF